MKNLFVGLIVVLSAFTAQAQNGKMDQVKTISLEQTEGAFTQEAITVKAGTYIFEISNKDVDHELGFVLAPKGKTEPENHIKAAYVTKTVATNTTGYSNHVKLEKGEYVYFCPLNPTPEYTLIVK
ncbi:cupredoxin domain-containing protein [Crocinitomix catalasitica]|mgnify:CR=1 FL=1|uniref:cupredoxin domain-containing protein n=1 Tax=Crocinitomix catalasitica TaxID=184607 RepID=UPI000488BC65|nr:cupredoxin domain-containing protein [Crocinitomix catalasitica]